MDNSFVDTMERVVELASGIGVELDSKWVDEILDSKWVIVGLALMFLWKGNKKLTKEKR